MSEKPGHPYGVIIPPPGIKVIEDLKLIAQQNGRLEGAEKVYDIETREVIDEG